MKNIVADLRKNVVIITLPVTILTNLILRGHIATAARCFMSIYSTLLKLVFYI